MPSLTRRGARNVTVEIDRLASLIQTKHKTLGFSKVFAQKFAKACDIVSDAIEQHAIKLAVNETGKSVEPTPGNPGYDANAIGDDVGGPDEILPPVEPFMGGHFSQNWFHQLRDYQDGGRLGMSVNASIARLRKLAFLSEMSEMADALKGLVAQMDISDAAEVKALTGDLKKQVVVVEKVRDLYITQQAAGMIDPLLIEAVDKIGLAVSEQIPYLQQMVAGVDTGSPVAVMEFRKMVEGGSVKELVGIATSIVQDAAKGLKKEETPEKTAGEVPEAFKKNWKKDKGDADKDEDKGEEKKAAKKAEDDDDDDIEEKPEDSEEKPEEKSDESEDEEDGTDKTAANDFGFKLYE